MGESPKEKGALTKGALPDPSPAPTQLVLPSAPQRVVCSQHMLPCLTDRMPVMTATMMMILDFLLVRQQSNGRRREP